LYKAFVLSNIKLKKDFESKNNNSMFFLGDNRNGCGAFPMAKVPREILKFNAFKAGQGTAS